MTKARAKTLADVRARQKKLDGAMGSVVVSMSALIRTLINKGLITEEDYDEARAMEEAIMLGEEEEPLAPTPTDIAVDAETGVPLEAETF